jgi:hypothetical protein
MNTIEIKVKPFIIDVTPEREDIYTRAKKAFQEAETLMNDADLHVRYRLRAMEILGKLARVLAGFLEDVQLDAIEADLEELKREAARKT